MSIEKTIVSASGQPQGRLSAYKHKGQGWTVQYADFGGDSFFNDSFVKTGLDKHQARAIISGIATY